jgi:TPR repeat protein
MKEAAKWFQKAAEQGDENAKSQLDYMSIVGEL